MQPIKMIKNKKSHFYFIGLLGFLLLASILFMTDTKTPAYAQSVNGYELTWWTVDSGGETLTRGGSYTLDSAAGQAEAAQFTSTGVEYSLQSGFWSGRATDYLTWYFPVVLK